MANDTNIAFVIFSAACKQTNQKLALILTLPKKIKAVYNQSRHVAHKN